MFALIHDNEIKVGPRDWNRTFFLDYLRENNLNTGDLRSAIPQTTVIGDSWRIIPVNTTVPVYDSMFEQLAGPFFVIGETEVTASYTVENASTEMIKGKLKEIVTKNRYDREVGGCDFTCDDTSVVKVYTDRLDRNVYLAALLTTENGDSVTFKFKNGVWKTLSKSEIERLVGVIKQHVQNAFAWEAGTHAQIDACVTREEFAAIDIGNPILTLP